MAKHRECKNGKPNAQTGEFSFRMAVSANNPDNSLSIVGLLASSIASVATDLTQKEYISLSKRDFRL